MDNLNPAIAVTPAHAQSERIPRPFGIHVTVRWWQAALIVVLTPVLFLVLQIALHELLVVPIDGRADPNRPEVTPLGLASGGLSTALTALVLVAVLSRWADVPWRVIFRGHGRFDWRRFGLTMLGAALLVGIANLVISVVAPDSTGRTSFEFTAVTALVLAVTLIATPLAAAGEEVIFRGVVMPAVGSWFKNTIAALLVAVLISGVLFTAIHVSASPWFIAYCMVISVATAAMGVITGGLEAAIAFHVTNNVFVQILNTLFAGDSSSVIDRGTSSPLGAELSILMLMNVAVVGFVWLTERSRKRPRSPRRAA